MQTSNSIALMHHEQLCAQTEEATCLQTVFHSCQAPGRHAPTRHLTTGQETCALGQFCRTQLPHNQGPIKGKSNKLGSYVTTVLQTQIVHDRSYKPGSLHIQVLQAQDFLIIYSPKTKVLQTQTP